MWLRAWALMRLRIVSYCEERTPGRCSELRGVERVVGLVQRLLLLGKEERRERPAPASKKESAEQMAVWLLLRLLDR